MLQWLFVVAMPLLIVACAPSAHRCDCHLVEGRGCFIHVPAPKGFKCKCTSMVASRGAPYTSYPWHHCVAEAFHCRNDEACPGGRYSYCACVQGGGDCRGYQRWPFTVESCSKVNKVEASSSLRQYSYKACGCDDRRDSESSGCRIVKPAPEGFKCWCSYQAGFCRGDSIGCDEDEYCPADDYTYCGCLRGGGNCDGYRLIDRDLDCRLGTTCDCNRSIDWTRDRYSIIDTQVNTDKRTISGLNHIGNFSTLEIQNDSDVEQKKSWTEAGTTTSESSFERTHGVSVDIGIPFFVRIPLTLQAPRSFTFGEKTTTSIERRFSYECKSPPKTHILCSAYLMSYDMTAPYTMLLKHNKIPDCTCESFGNWRSTTTYHSNMIVKTLGPCNSIVNGKCEE